MNYSIDWHSQAFDFLNKLQKDIVLRITKKLDEVKEDPFRFLEHYEGQYYKLRIGDYRLLIDIDFDRKILWIRVLDKRGRIYKR
ncbi:MAG: type II toxin-antitoxin system RelE/ParE family toxin [Nanoarchaeota archaeon]